MTTNEELLNRVIRHAVYLERYKSGVVNRMLVALRLANDELFQLLLQRLISEEITGQALSVEVTARIDAQIAAINAQRAQNIEAIGRELLNEIRELAEYETPFTVGMIDDAIPIQWSLITPPPEQVYAAALARPFQGKLLREVLDEFAAADARIIRETIRIGYLNGLTTQQIVRSLIGTRRMNYEDGAIDASRRGIEAVVRTALQHTASVARNEVYKANNEIIKAVKFVATLDSRTTPLCRSLDSKVFPIDKPYPKPPLHFRCRSSTSPVTKSWRELGFDIDEAPEGTRASMNGQVPESETYETWLRKQPADFQKESFKAAYRNWEEKYRLWKQGELTVDKFVNVRSGQELTLAQLREREPEAFRRAGL